MMILETILKGVFCHLVGDYVLQIDFIAKTKGENWYHLFVHCALYCLPVYLAFGFNSRLFGLFVSHFVVDMFKARYHLINYASDQLVHYAFIVFLYII